jgi:hypothetical protein
MPIDKRAMVGPNLLFMPRGPQMTIAGLTVPDDIVRNQILSSISIGATHLQEISLDRCGRYMLRCHGPISIGASSSTRAGDLYDIVDIPSPLEVLAISHVDALHRMTSYLASDLLGSYQALSIVTGIPLCVISGHINHILSCIVGS